MSVEDSRGSSGSATPDEAFLRHVMDRIKLICQEFEELLLLRYAAETLKDFGKRLLQEEWTRMYGCFKIFNFQLSFCI